MTLNRLLTTTAFVTALAVSPMIAGQAQAQVQMDGAQMDAAEIMANDSMIDAFIAVALDVAATREGYITQLEAATDEAEQMAIVEAADAAILDVVESAEGITLEQYIAVGEAAAADPELAAHIQARFAETQADG